MQVTKSDSGNLESAIMKLRGMSPETKNIITSLMCRLADAEGVSPKADYRAPAENIDQWLPKLRSEHKSERTINLYEYLVRRFLKQLTSPTRADIREYLAKRIQDTSASSEWWRCHSSDLLQRSM